MISETPLLIRMGKARSALCPSHGEARMGSPYIHFQVCAQVFALCLDVHSSQFIPALQQVSAAMTYAGRFNNQNTTGTGGVIGPHYASSKSALHGLVHWLSLRYCKHGVVSLIMHSSSLRLGYRVWVDCQCHLACLD